MSQLYLPQFNFLWTCCSKKNGNFFFFLNSHFNYKTASAIRFSATHSLFSRLLRLRPGDRHVPPGPELHPEPRGRLLLCVCGGARDWPRVSVVIACKSYAARNLRRVQTRCIFSHLSAPFLSPPFHHPPPLQAGDGARRSGESLRRRGAHGQHHGTTGTSCLPPLPLVPV